MKDNDWTYDIKADEKNPLAFAAIGRKNRQGQSEFWHKDDARGTETIQTLDGVKKVKSWFTRGVLAGKPRKIEETKEGQTTTTYRAAYDENGKLIREVVGQQQGVATVSTYDEGRLKAIQYPNGELESYVYTKNGKLQVRKDSKGNIWVHEYQNGEKVAISLNNKLWWSKEDGFTKR